MKIISKEVSGDVLNHWELQGHGLKQTEMTGSKGLFQIIVHHLHIIYILWFFISSALNL